MTRQSSDDQQFCAAQILEAADDRKYCAAQMDLARNQQYAATRRRYTAEPRNISAYAKQQAPAISAGEGVLEKVAADVVAAVGGRRI